MEFFIFFLSVIPTTKVQTPGKIFVVFKNIWT